jgi:SAM-dependent methyltransferase
MKIHDLNKVAWDQAVGEGTNPYTKVMSPEQITEARRGKWSLYLSDCKPVPEGWFPNLRGLKVLCLASGGGQQAPIFAALGAEVTLLDASPRQLAQDQFVAERDNLIIKIVEGDMADLSAFADERFELIFNPPSTLFVPDLEPVWRECYRVLRVGGLLMTGFMNPDEFIFDDVALDNEGTFVVKYALPYVEHEALGQEALEARIRHKEMFHFSHTMEAQLGGLTKAGFVITGFYEDRRSEEDGNPIRHYMPSYYVVRAQKGGVVIYDRPT